MGRRSQIWDDFQVGTGQFLLNSYPPVHVEIPLDEGSSRGRVMMVTGDGMRLEKVIVGEEDGNFHFLADENALHLAVQYLLAGDREQMFKVRFINNRKTRLITYL